ncbi:histidinol-phosphatase [Amphritea sp. 2_MG-2023]|uniref:histidinol-phosphatase n=1 Tax=Amphritea TaxID=515417 RepID=UPI001C076537|nr:MULTISPECIES: histidinol-phosphatase [Amphritea]MBU2964107.1 histidinol-phosphatase [Amphritea atlantica]MDO6418505.1 histidinol-phosphatase [Amphritea sp. 2_MG-2023]
MQASLIRVANEVVECSGAIIRHYFRKPLDIIHKGDMSPVTIADRETEAAMRAVINQHFPHHSIIGEEGEDTIGSQPYTWTMDPIDGTKSFITGNPLFGTLLCLSEENTPMIGIIDIPISKERWVGMRHEGATYNGHTCHVSNKTQLSEAQLYCTEPDLFTPQQAECFQALEKHVRLRRFGGDCYSYGLLASGHIDLVVEASLHPYDWMALIPVIEGAGGIITDWNGNPLNNNSDGTVIAAATRELHAQALSVFKHS